jgi:hypothetical protein
LKFCKKKVPAIAGAFLRFLRAFLGGSGDTRVFSWFFGGEFVVNSWWLMVSCVAYFGARKTCHCFELYFSEFHFGQMGKLDVRDYRDYRERWWGVWRVPYWLRKSLVRAGGTG